MRYFLTGGTGFVGNPLARALLAQGHDVVVLARSPHGARDLNALGARIVQGSILDRNALSEGMKGADGVFHLAWDKSGETALQTKTNLDGTRLVFQVMRESRISRGVYTSSFLINGETNGEMADENWYYDGAHSSVMGQVKWRVHFEIARPMTFEGLPLTIVIPGAIYGPGDTGAIASMFESWLRNRLFVIPRTLSLSWCHVDDAVAGLILAMEKGLPGESYNLSGPDHKLADAFQYASNLVRRKAPRAVSPSITSAITYLFAQVGAIVELPPHLQKDILRMYLGTWTGTDAKARRELGFIPRDLRMGLGDTLTDIASRVAKQRLSTKR